MAAPRSHKDILRRGYIFLGIAEGAGRSASKLEEAKLDVKSTLVRQSVANVSQAAFDYQVDPALWKTFGISPQLSLI